LDEQPSLAADEDNDFREPGEDREEFALRPYAESGGEVEMYRFRLELNHVGEAFLLCPITLIAAPGHEKGRTSHRSANKRVALIYQLGQTKTGV